MSNKIKYGLKNVYYAVATIAADGSATYETPVALPGAVSLSMDPQGELTPFYADNIVFYMSSANNGYEGDLTLAMVPDSFKKDVLGYVEDTKKVLVEDADAEPAHFALLFQFEGDSKAIRRVLYNCVAGRPTDNGNTKEENVSPETDQLSLTATTIYNASLDKNVVKAECNDTTDADVYAGWFTNVYIPAINA
jgi:phi13 family phage major tail protein